MALGYQVGQQAANTLKSAEDDAVTRISVTTEASLQRIADTLTMLEGQGLAAVTAERTEAINQFFDRLEPYRLELKRFNDSIEKITGLLKGQ